MQIFDVIIFLKLRTIQQKTVKPTYLCPLGARKLAEGKGHRIIMQAEEILSSVRKEQGTYVRIFFFFFVKTSAVRFARKSVGSLRKL